MAELGAGNGTSFPTEVDTRQTYINGPNPRPDSSSRIDAEMVNDLMAAVIALENNVAGKWTINGNDIYNSNSGNVGIGTSTPTSKFHIEETRTDLTGTIYGRYKKVVANPPSASTAAFMGDYNYSESLSGNAQDIGSIYTVWNEARHNGTGVLGVATPTFSGSNNYSTGTITLAYGLRTRVYNTSSGTITTARGIYTQCINASTGVITEAHGSTLEMRNSSTGTITSAYGSYINFYSNAGTITNAYGLYINQVLGTNKWGIYVNDTSPNYFAGYIGINQTIPTAPIHVKTSEAAGSSYMRLSGETGWHPLTLENAADTTYPCGRIDFETSRGTLAAKTTTLTDDRLGSINFQSHNGTSYGGAAVIQANASANGRGGNLHILTSPSGSSSSSERLSVMNDGKVGIGTATPATSAKLDISGTDGALLVPRLTTTQRDALTPSNGMIIYNTTVNDIQKYANSVWGSEIFSSALDSITPLNNVTRLRFSDWNFISNSSFESWLSGTTVAPDGWYTGGTITVARDSTPFQGTYSAALTFGAATDGEMYAIFGANSAVDYTYTAYVTRLSGTGNARLVAQQNFGSYVEDASVAMSTTSGQQLVTLSFIPSASGNYRIAFKATDAAGSVWRVDEVKVQESKQIATAWTPNFIDDSFSQDIYGHKTFKGGLGVTSGTPGVGKVLTSDANGVATWETPGMGSTITTLALSDDFIGGINATGQVGSLGWRWYGNGVIDDFDYSSASNPGVARLKTNGALNDLVVLYMNLYSVTNPTCWIDGPSNFDISFVVTPAYATVADMQLSIGIGQNISIFGAGNLGATFQYDSSSSAYWKVSANVAGDVFIADTDVTVTAGVYYRLRIIGNGTNLKFYINDVLKKTFTNSDLGGADWFAAGTYRAMPLCKVSALAASTKGLYIDFFEIILTGLSRY